LDNHTISSEYDNRFGNFRTKRTIVGELLFRLKYRREWHNAWRLGRIASDFLISKIQPDKIDCIVTIPPSKFRIFFQPVKLVGWRIGRLLKIPVYRNTLKANRSFKRMKSLENHNERIKLMRNRLYLKSNILSGNSVLLFDDLYRSGATLNEAARALWANGKIKSLYVLTLSKTRVRR